MNMRLASVICFLLISIVTMIGCQKRDLRGKAEPSKDGQTYLVVDDDNGGACGQIFIDGKQWTHKTHEQGTITPGRHTIKCGTEIEFEIQQATIFYFNYWGP